QYVINYSLGGILKKPGKMSIWLFVVRRKDEWRDRRLLMKYMLLIYYDEQVLEKAGKVEEARIERECLEQTKELEKKGKFLGAHRLHSVSTATSIKTKDGKRLVTHGPLAETPE